MHLSGGMKAWTPEQIQELRGLDTGSSHESTSKAQMKRL